MQGNTDTELLEWLNTEILNLSTNVRQWSEQRRPCLTILTFINTLTFITRNSVIYKLVYGENESTFDLFLYTVGIVFTPKSTAFVVHYVLAMQFCWLLFFHVPFLSPSVSKMRNSISLWNEWKNRRMWERKGRWAVKREGGSEREREIKWASSSRPTCDVITVLLPRSRRK